MKHQSIVFPFYKTSILKQVMFGLFGGLRFASSLACVSFSHKWPIELPPLLRGARRDIGFVAPSNPPGACSATPLNKGGKESTNELVIENTRRGRKLYNPLLTSPRLGGGNTTRHCGRTLQYIFKLVFPYCNNRLGGSLALLFFMIFVCVCSVSASSEIVFVRTPEKSLETVDSSTSIESYFAARYVNGSHIVRADVDHPQQAPVNLTPDFISACDPSVSFDGKSILFAGKKTTNGRWQIWRMRLSDGRTVQVTNRKTDCIQPLWVGSLFHLNDKEPTGRIVYVSREVDENGSETNWSLYSSDVSGWNELRITHNLGDDFDPVGLPNGRIVYSSWKQEKETGQPKGRFALLGINNDGTDLMPYFGNHEWPFFHFQPHSGLDGRLYFVQNDWPNGLQGGRLASVSMRRPLHSYQKITEETDGEFLFPCRLPDGRLLAAQREKHKDSSYNILQFKPENPSPPTVLFDEPGWHLLDAQSLAVRDPMRGRSTVVDETQNTGVYYCLDVYRSNIKNWPSVKRGTVKELRVVEGIQQNNERQCASSVTKRILGIAPVEPDGSFHIEVPAETPLSFHLLDQNGIALAKQSSWTWVMPNEKRGCIGCHEDREMAPPNILPEAVIKPAVQLTLPPERRRTVDFENNILPIVQTNCSNARCHEQGQPFIGSYEQILPTIKKGSALESKLIWTLIGDRLEGTVPNPFGFSKNDHDCQYELEEYELRLLIEWIDLGASQNVKPDQDAEL